MTGNQSRPRWLKWAVIVAFILIVVSVGIVPASQRVYSQEPAATAANPEVQLVPDGVVVAKNKKFTVQVKLTSNPAGAEICGYEFTLNHGLSAHVSSTDAGFLGQTGRTVPPDAYQGEALPELRKVSTNKVEFGAYSVGDQAGPTGTGVLAEIELEATQEGQATLDLADVMLVGCDATDYTVDVTRTQASLEVTAASTAVFSVDKYGNVYGNAFNWGTAADIAEFVVTSRSVEPGDLVEIDPEHPGHYRKTSTAYSKLVSGVISSKPAITMGQPVGDVGGVVLALMGRVPVKASAENGPIQVGDLLVSSSTPGHVMRCTELEKKCAGALIGKALGSLNAGMGTIEMLVVR